MVQTGPAEAALGRAARLWRAGAAPSASGAARGLGMVVWVQPGASGPGLESFGARGGLLGVRLPDLARFWTVSDGLVGAVVGV